MVMVDLDFEGSTIFGSLNFTCVVCPKKRKLDPDKAIFRRQGSTLQPFLHHHFGNELLIPAVACVVECLLR